MTQDEIIQMARKAGMAYEEESNVYVANIDDLQDFAKLVAAKEREACAKVCAELGEWACVHDIEARGEQA